ncbi:MAG: triose-phosphate isomerase [Spirochaetes bacterium]|jgi:triosephosphate isomerase|nr:triose-phosphate isomerase [Spirochaetota bacterium]
MSRRVIISGNWKMYNTTAEAKELVEGLLAGVKDLGEKEMLIFPPSIHLKEVVAQCEGSKIQVGAQNMYFKEEGAFTGEISPTMVKDAGADYILIAHSERRHVFGETDELINDKVKAAFLYDLKPVLCIGELLEDYEAGKSKEVCRNQLVEDLKGISAEQMKQMVIAYEPVWAIGTGKVATPEIAESIHMSIREVLKELYSEEIAELVPVLYGGSVKPDNAAGLLVKPNIDGVLVGGACLKADSFLGIANA